MKKFIVILAIFVSIGAVAVIVMQFRAKPQNSASQQATALPNSYSSSQSVAPPPSAHTEQPASAPAQPITAAQPSTAPLVQPKDNPPPAKPQPIRTVPIAIAADQMEARLIRKVPAHVPRSLDQRGTVVFNATINESGQVVTLDLLSNAQDLEQYARSAVMQWQYKPYLLDGKAEAVKTTVMIQVGWDARR